VRTPSVCHSFSSLPSGAPIRQNDDRIAPGGRAGIACGNPARPTPSPERTQSDNLVSAMKMLSLTHWLACIILIAGCAGRTDVIVLDDRLAAVESQLARQKAQIERLDQTSENKEQDLRSQSANLRVEMQSLREQIGAINGRLEEVEYQINREQSVSGEAQAPRATEPDRLREELRAMNSRITSIEQQLERQRGAKPSEATSKSAPKAAPAPLASLSEKDLYDRSKQAFDAGQLDKAREGFEEFTRRFPESQNADNAQFWIGEIYYREKWYEKAIVEYQKVVENFPKGNKIRSAMLKQGYAFLNIGEKANARLILRDLIQKYPDTTEAELAKQKLSEIK
jgi:tol-pal system protein YbgF